LRRRHALVAGAMMLGEPIGGVECQPGQQLMRREQLPAQPLDLGDQGADAAHSSASCASSGPFSGSENVTT
jgi:hypothetical protein